jgi:hypothetical protein
MRARKENYREELEQRVAEQALELEQRVALIFLSRSRLIVQ